MAYAVQITSAEGWSDIAQSPTLAGWPTGVGVEGPYPGARSSRERDTIRDGVRMYPVAAAELGATLGERVSRALLVPRLDGRQRQQVQEVQRRSELQQGQKVEGRRHRGPLGQPRRLFQLLQPLGKVLGEDVDIAAVGLALAGHAVIPPCPAAGNPCP